MTSSWPYLPLKRLLDVQTGSWGDEPDGENDIPCVRVADFDRAHLRVEDPPTLRSLPSLERQKLLVRPGDLLIEKSGGTSVNPVGCVVRYEGDGPAVCSNFVARLRPHPGHSTRFWKYALGAAYLDGRSWPFVRQTTGIQNLDLAGWLSMRVAVPALPEQVAIADFLDRETAKIDALIDKQLAFIGGLGERRERLHSSIVGRQSDWPRVALRHVTSLIVDCPHWTPEVVDDSEYEAVRSGCIRDGEYRPAAALKVSREVFDARNRGISLDAGDVLFAREAPAGEACLVPEGRNLCLGQRTVLLKVDRTQIAPELVIANLYSKRVQDRFLVEMNGSTVGNLRLPVIRGTALAVPPRQAQQALVAEYVDALAHLSRLTANAKRLIELAQERRAALITAAVTRQLDVSTGARVYC